MNESNGYACPGPEEFQEILEGLFTEGSMNQCQQKINYMLDEELNDLFRCCALAIQQPNATKTVIYNALIVIKRPITPTLNMSLNKVREKWFSSRFMESRNLTKESVVYCLTSEYIEVRNEAAHCITYLLIIEQEKWADLIPFLIGKLTFENTSDNAKSGIISTFKEIFSTSDIFNPKVPVNSIPPSFADLFNFLLFQLSYEGLDQDKYIECTDCVEFMLARIPQFFIPNIEKNINDILTAIGKTFPLAEYNLYKQYHFLMLQIIDTFYDYADKFMDRITEFSLNGFTSEFRTISIDFWNYVYLIEKNRKFAGIQFYFIRKKSSEILLEKILNLNLELKDPQITDYQIADINDWNFFCTMTLTKIVKASLKGDPNQRKDKIVNTIFNYIQYCTNEAEKNLSTLLAIISTLSTICVKYTYEQCSSFVISYFPFIIEYCHNSYSRVSVNSLLLLNKLIKKNYSLLSKPEFVEKILDTVNSQINSSEEIIIDLLIRIMINCSTFFKPNAKLSIYHDIRGIVEKMISTDFIINSSLNGKVYLILTKYYQKFYDDKKRNIDFLIENGKLLLDETLKKLNDSFSLMISNLGSLQIELFALIKTLIRYLGSKAEEYLEGTIELMLKIVRNQNYMEESFIVLTSVAYANGSKILNYMEPILQSIDCGFTSQSPLIIGKSALLIGAVFYNLQTLGIPYIKSSFDRIFSLLEDPQVDNTKDYYADVVFSIALIIRGLDIKFPTEARLAYTEKLIQLSHTPISPNNESNLEEKSKLFYNVAYGFFAIFDAYHQKDPGFLEIFNITDRRFKKNIIVEFLKYVGITGIYKGSQLFYYLQLISIFITVTKTKYNAQLHIPAITDIIFLGLKSKNEDVIDLSNQLVKRLEKI